MNYRLQELKEFLLSKSHYEDGPLREACGLVNAFEWQQTVFVILCIILFLQFVMLARLR